MTPEQAGLPSASKPRVGLRLGGFDAAALAKAEAALKSLSGQFAGWMQDELAKLEASHADVRACGLAGGAGDLLYTRAHDLKGLGGTYEFPIVTRMAASLCRLLDTPTRRAAAPLPLVTAHVEAVRRMVTEDIRTDDDPRGETLAQSLEAQVSAVLADAKLTRS